MVSGQNLYSTKFLCMSSLPARMKMIQSKLKELEWSQHFSHYKYMGFFRRSRAPTCNSAALCLIWPNFKLGRDFMVFLVTCKIKKIRSKMKALECSQHYASFLDAQGQVTPESMVDI